MIERIQRRQNPQAPKRRRGAGLLPDQGVHASSVQRLLESGPRPDRTAGACDNSCQLPFFESVVPGHAMPVCVSKKDQIYCMKNSVLGLGTGWPLHVQIYRDRQVVSCTELCCAELYYTVLYCTVLCCTVLCCTVLYCAVLWYTLLYLCRCSKLSTAEKSRAGQPMPLDLESVINNRYGD
jgi:hypothetical protein